MSRKSTTTTAISKAAKPWADFPLTAHRNGSWCKKVRGVVIFFGPIHNPLGVNAGLGNSDCGHLLKRHLDLTGGWLNFPRPKTGVSRRARL